MLLGARGVRGDVRGVPGGGGSKKTVCSPRAVVGENTGARAVVGEKKRFLEYIPLQQYNHLLVLL